jgi:branched-chain amino acid transport system permease protein
VNWVNAVIQGMLLGGQYALIACGLSLMFGVMRIVNLAHGDLAVCGAYLGLVLSSALGVPVWITLPLLAPPCQAAPTFRALRLII